MLRDVGLEDISDGRLYRENDMVKTDTNSCQGCKKICCIGMGRTIVLDPYDCYRLGIGTGKGFEQLTLTLKLARDTAVLASPPPYTAS